MTQALQLSLIAIFSVIAVFDRRKSPVSLLLSQVSISQVLPPQL
jgi:hypothetical protein